MSIFFKNNNEANVEKNARTKKYFGRKISKSAAKHIFLVGTPLKTYGNFFSRWNDPQNLREFFFLVGTTPKTYGNFFFSLERPSKPTGNFFSRWNDPQANGKFYFSCPTTPPYLNYLRNFVSTCAGRVWRTFRFEQ